LEIRLNSCINNFFFDIMAKLPKKYIKKYGISKKAWAEYRKSLKKPSSKKSSGGKRKSQGKTAKKQTGRKKNMSFNFGGGLGKGIAVGVAAGVVNKFIPVNIAGADLIIAGMIMKDTTVQKIGAIELGRNLAGTLTGFLGGGGDTTQGSGY
jgi:hypothetical protein